MTVSKVFSTTPSPLTCSGKPEQPEIRVRDGVENSAPSDEGVGIDLVQLVEIAVNDAILGQPVLTARCQNDLFGNLFACVK